MVDWEVSQHKWPREKVEPRDCMLNQRTRRQASQRGEIRRQISQVGGMCNGSPNNYEGPHLARECPKRKWGSFTLAGAQVELDEEEEEEEEEEEDDEKEEEGLRGIDVGSIIRTLNLLIRREKGTQKRKRERKYITYI